MAEAVVRALRRKPIIQVVPYSHVMPVWIVKRVSTRAAQTVARMAPRLARR